MRVLLHKASPDLQKAIDSVLQDTEPELGKLAAYMRYGDQEYKLLDWWCMDCGESFEGYMVHPRIWHEATGRQDGKGLLCLTCLEHRLGRTLQPGDFPRLPVNRPLFFLLDRQA